MSTDQDVSERLRTQEKGLMKTNKLGPTLPTRAQGGYTKDQDGSYNIRYLHLKLYLLNQIHLLDLGGNLQSLFAGDVRAEDQPALNSMHTLFLNEHNRIATLIHKKHEAWTDTTIFEEAKKIVIGEFQNIVYTHYLQIVLGSAFIKQNLPELELPSDPSGDSAYDNTVDC